jgi:hypothetical protein
MIKFIANLFSKTGGSNEKHHCKDNACANSPSGKHAYEWGGKYLIAASAITSESRLDTKLQCHYCSATIGKQAGKSVLD